MSRAKTFSQIWQYMIERENVRRRKEIEKLPKPWTKDPVLRSVKFTNVKRSDDKTTRELVAALNRPNTNAPPAQVLRTAAMARYFGRSEFAIAAGWQKSFQPAKLVSLASRRLEQGLPVFTGAYVITNGGIARPKQEVVVNHYLAELEEKSAEVRAAFLVDYRWEDAARVMMTVPGFGGTGFMTKEVLQDCMLTGFMSAAQDRRTWSPCGPGAQRGLNRVFRGLTGDDVDKHRWKPNDAVIAMRKLLQEVEAHWPEDFPELELHDIQFALCEWDKYQRVARGEGRAKNTYDGG